MLLQAGLTFTLQILPMDPTIKPHTLPMAIQTAASVSLASVPNHVSATSTLGLKMGIEAAVLNKSSLMMQDLLRVLAAATARHTRTILSLDPEAAVPVHRLPALWACVPSVSIWGA